MRLIRYVWKKNSWHSIFDTAPYSPENTVTTVRPRLSELLCFVKKCWFSEV